MKTFIAGLLLGLLLTIIAPLSFAQQNQNTQKPNPEIEALKERISELENKLQVVENVEKMELAAKLAEAQAKLHNAEFGKLERDLRNSNHKWLIGWIVFFLTVLAVVGTPLWLLLKSGVNRIITNLKSNADQLIADSVEKSLNGFKETVEQVDTLKIQLKEALAQVNILQSQIGVLEKEHAASMLGNFMHYRPEDYPEQIKVLPEQAVLDVFSDETRHLELRGKAAEVLTYKQSPRLVSPALKFLNSVVDSDFDWEQNFVTQYHIGNLASFLEYISTPEAYEGLKKFLERLLTENPGDKSIVLTPTAFSLAYVSNKLNKRDSVSILKRAIPFFRTSLYEEQHLSNLSEYFDRFKKPDGIKEILKNGLTNMMPEVETQCLGLLQKHDPDFVKEWQAQKETANTQSKESS